MATPYDFASMQDACAAISTHFDKRPDSATKCQLGDLMIVKGEGAVLGPKSFYVMGFNGGEPTNAPSNTQSRSATVWFNRCRDAAKAVGVSSWIIGERAHWGSPTVGELRSRIGSDEAFRDLLRLHAAANRAVFQAYPPLLVWAPGVSTCLQEMIEDYALKEVGSAAMRERGGILWRQFCSKAGVPWLVTLHPTGAWMRRDERLRINERLGQLARAVR